jgi:uncharacterized protein
MTFLLVVDGHITHLPQFVENLLSGDCLLSLRKERALRGPGGSPKKTIQKSLTVLINIVSDSCLRLGREVLMSKGLAAKTSAVVGPLVVGLVTMLGVAPVTAQSFDCGKAEAGSIEEMICKDGELSGLDEKMAEVYKEAQEKALNEHPPVLKAEQRGWIKGRDECWKSDDKRECVKESYVLRIAELQARYRLVPFKGPIFYMCNDQPANEVVATFFDTEPPTLIAERGDQTSFMVLQPSASGSKYQGRNETFWEKAGEAMVTWGYGSPEMRCKVRP